MWGRGYGVLFGFFMLRSGVLRCCFSFGALVGAFGLCGFLGCEFRVLIENWAKA